MILEQNHEYLAYVNNAMNGNKPVIKRIKVTQVTGTCYRITIIDDKLRVWIQREAVMQFSIGITYNTSANNVEFTPLPIVKGISAPGVVLILEDITEIKVIEESSPVSMDKYPPIMEDTSEKIDIPDEDFSGVKANTSQER